MKEILKILVKVVDLVRVLSSFLSFVFAISWFFQILSLPFVNAISYFFEPIAKIVRGIIFHQITFDGKQFDSTYVITAVIFGLIFYAATRLQRYLLIKIEDEIFKENMRRARQEVKTNTKISKEFKKQMSKINYFIICVNLSLKYTISETLVENRTDLNEVRDANYKDIMDTMNVAPATTVEIKGDKVAIMCPHFYNFESIFDKFLDATDKVSAANKKKDIATDIYFVVDAAETNHFTTEKQTFLSKVLSFGYKNKAVTTTAFAKRYEQEKNNAFVLNTMGKIRFFEDKIEGQLEQRFTDFELFTLKRKRA